MMYIDSTGLVRWRDAASATWGLIGNGAGVLVGGALLGAPEPTMSTKAIGGIVMAKSLTSWGINWYNLTRAFSDDSSYDVPSTAFRGIAALSCPGNKDAERIADATELAIDFMSGRALIGGVPQAGSALNRPVNFSQAQDYGKIGTSATNVFVNTMQTTQTIQYSNDAINN